MLGTGKTPTVRRTLLIVVRDRSRNAWAPVVLWMAGIAWISVSAPAGMPSGSDFWLHAFAYGVLAWLLRRAVGGEGVRSVIVPVVVAWGFGFLLEGVQIAVPDRTFEVGDLIANGLGVIVAVLIPMRRRSAARHP